MTPLSPPAGLSVRGSDWWWPKEEMMTEVLYNFNELTRNARMRAHNKPYYRLKTHSRYTHRHMDIKVDIHKGRPQNSHRDKREHLTCWQNEMRCFDEYATRWRTGSPDTSLPQRAHCCHNMSGNSPQMAVWRALLHSQEAVITSSASLWILLVCLFHCLIRQAVHLITSWKDRGANWWGPKKDDIFLAWN